MSFVYNCKLLLENRNLPILFAHHLLVNCFYISTCSLSLLFNTKNEIFKFFAQFLIDLDKSYQMWDIAKSQELYDDCTVMFTVYFHHK